jgi:hypothetical protein
MQSPPLICKWCVIADLHPESGNYIIPSCICIGIAKSYNTPISYSVSHAVSINNQTLQHASYPDSNQFALPCGCSPWVRS